MCGRKFGVGDGTKVNWRIRFHGPSREDNHHNNTNDPKNPLHPSQSSPTRTSFLSRKGKGGMRRFTEKILNPTAGKKLITPDNWEARTHPPRTNTTMSMSFKQGGRGMVQRNAQNNWAQRRLSWMVDRAMCEVTSQTKKKQGYPGGTRENL